jgi:hypothetical protein
MINFLQEFTDKKNNIELNLDLKFILNKIK